MCSLRGIAKECSSYPCHEGLEDCTFCYCPLYPCLDPWLGELKGGERVVWSCRPCSFVHRRDVAAKLQMLLPEFEGGLEDQRVRWLLKRRLEAELKGRRKAWFSLAKLYREDPELLAAFELGRRIRRELLKVEEAYEGRRNRFNLGLREALARDYSCVCFSKRKFEAKLPLILGLRGREIVAAFNPGRVLWVLPPQPFLMLSELKAVSGSPSLEGHRLLVATFGLREEKELSSVVVGFDIR